MPAKTLLRVVSNRVRAEDLDLDPRARAMYLDLTSNRPLFDALRALDRHRWYRVRQESPAAARGVTSAGRELIDLSNAGATPAEGARLVLFLQQLHAELWPAGALRELPALDLEDFRTDCAEESMEKARHLHGATPDELRREAEHCEAQAAVSVEKARRLTTEAARRDRETGMWQRPMSCAPKAV